jgi:hypothetical protein
LSGLSPRDVTAVIVTRGNVNTVVAEIAKNLIFDDIVIWDNSRETVDQMTYGRALAAITRTRNTVVYSQDDDILHTPEDQRRILAAYEPGVMTGCMWDEWSAGAKAQGIPNGYDDLAFAGSGSIYDRWIPMAAIARYLEHYPEDDFMRLWADCIVGVLAETKNLPIVFEELAVADDPYRMCKQPDAAKLKAEAIRRARHVRGLTTPNERKPDAHRAYMNDILAGKHPENRHL